MSIYLASSTSLRASRGTVLKVAAAAVVVLTILALHRYGVLDSFANPARLKRAMVELGPWGFAAFIGSYAALQPFGVPGTVFVMAAPLVWPWPVAFALSMAGTMAASVIGFSFARFVGRELIADKIPARIKKYEDALERRAFTTVAVLRFLFWMPQWLHVFFGVSRVPFWTHFWGSVVGYAVPLFFVSYFGEQLFAMLEGLSTGTWVAIGVATLAVVVSVWLYVRSRAVSPRARDSSPVETPAPPG